MSALFESLESRKLLDAGPVNIDWSMYEGRHDIDINASVVCDDAGNMYVSGHSLSLWGYDNLTMNNGYEGGLGWAFNNEPTFDSLVAKYDALGDLQWFNFVGGFSDDYGNDVAIDSNGDVYLLTTSEASDIQGDGPWEGRSVAMGWCLYVSKFDGSDGSHIEHRFIGNVGNDRGYGIAIDSNDDILIVGESNSNSFYGFDPPLFPSNGAYQDAFILKMDNSLSLDCDIWTTFFGGSATDIGFAIAIGDNDDIVISGYTESTNLRGALNTLSGISDSFVASFDSSGALLWSRYCGGENNEILTKIDRPLHPETEERIKSNDICLDSSYNIYVSGTTYSSFLPFATNSYHNTYELDHPDNFIQKISPDGSTCMWSTWTGGEYQEAQSAVVSDYWGNIYLAGYSASWVEGGDWTQYHAGVDGYVSKLSSESGSILTSTYIGGQSRDECFGICINTENPNNLITVGTTGSLDMEGAIDNYLNIPTNLSDSFICILSSIPEIEINLIDSIATEENSDEASVSITRTGTTTEAIEIFYSISGSADNGDDYTDEYGYPLSGSVVIPSGQSSVVISIVPVDDAIVEAEELVSISLLSDEDYFVGDNNTASCSIVDNDLPTIGISITSSACSEEGPVCGELTITRYETTSESLTVNYLIDLSGNHPALIGGDYDLLDESSNILTGSITIAGNESTVSIILCVYDDQDEEYTESVCVSLDSGDYIIDPNNAAATLYIEDNDVVLGDFNDDGALNGLDIPGFKDALADKDAWESATGRDADLIGDFNGDEVFNGLDIPGFKAALGS